MLFSLVATFFIASVFGDERNFTPSKPDMDFHTQRVWFWLNPKCFATEADAFSFKDFLLSKYQCINFNDNRKKIYQHPTVNGKVWSLWIELEANHYNFDCLNNNVTLPENIDAPCVTEVYFEPLQHVDQAACTEQTTADNLWSLDDMDGIPNSKYVYLNFGQTTPAVEAIVLDTDVDANHVEFSVVTTNNLFTGNLGPLTSQSHGTHVAGTVVGQLVGGAKGTALNYYPVCQLGSSCAWSDIEGGYEAAIALMLANPTKIYVINYSVGGGRTLSNELAYDAWGVRIQNSGNFWVTSAGNSASDACNFAPAFSTYALTIGSYTKGYVPTTRFSNYGSCVDTYAPGEFVYSAAPGGAYTTMSGTSMSSPNICALVINLLKQDSSLTLTQLKSYMASTNRPLIGVPPQWGDARAAYFATTCPM